MILNATYDMTGIMYVRILLTYLMTGIRCVTLCYIPYDRHNVLEHSEHTLFLS